MLEMIKNGNSPLCQAVRSAAASVPPVVLDPSQTSDIELVLARYARDPVRPDFDFRAISAVSINDLPAMWADCIGDDTEDVGKVASYGIPDVIALQVIRLWAPAGFRSGASAPAKNFEAKPLAATQLNDAHEYILKFTIPARHVARIDLDTSGSQFVVAPSNAVFVPHPDFPLPAATCASTSPRRPFGMPYVLT